MYTLYYLQNKRIRMESSFSNRIHYSIRDEESRLIDMIKVHRIKYLRKNVTITRDSRSF